MQFTPEQRIYQALCSTTGDVLCALDASSFDEAQQRALFVLATEPMVQAPMGNVRIIVMPPDEVQGAPHYFPHAFFVLQELRRQATMH